MNTIFYPKRKVHWTLGTCKLYMYKDPPILFSSGFQSGSNSGQETVRKWCFEPSLSFKLVSIVHLWQRFTSWIWCTSETCGKQCWRAPIQVPLTFPKAQINFILPVACTIPCAICTFCFFKHIFPCICWITPDFEQLESKYNLYRHTTHTSH